MGIITALLIGTAISAVVGAGASLGAQALQNKSTRETNELNKKINESNNTFNAEQADINREFSAEEAQKQRDFEAEMSNTAIQRRAADLQAAGFNPTLAATSVGASTPGAVSASGSQASASGFIPMKAMDYSPMAQLSNTLSHAVSSANSIAYLDKLAKNNPNVARSLTVMSNSMSRSMTRADKIPSKAELMKEIDLLSKAHIG